MTGYDVVLALHVLTLMAALLLAGLVHGAEYLSATGTTVTEVRRASRPLRLGPLFAVLTALLLVLGMALLGMSKDLYGFGDPFVWTALLAIAYLLLAGPLVLGPHEARLRAAAEQAPDGPVPADLRALLVLPRPWRVSYANSFTAIAVVLNMILKPGTVGCLLIVLAGALVGVGTGQLLSRRAAATAALSS